MKTEYGNKIIALYMGLIHNPYNPVFSKPENVVYRNGLPESGHWMSPEYHSSWNWQIPVYSKLAKKMYEVVKKIGGDNTPEFREQYYQVFVDRYNLAIWNNDIQKGFEIIVENLQWLDDHKK